jgi:hypothetical protein
MPQIHGPASPSLFIADTASSIGFRTGTQGTHTSRTMMFEELRAVLLTTPKAAAKTDYRKAIIEDNCLSKATTATRRLTAQRLSEIYALDPAVPLFRALRNVWSVETEERGRRLLALLAAIGRDPLLAATVSAVIPVRIDQELTRFSMTAALRSSVGDRFNDSILDKVARNAGSSWTQSGHLKGRTFKRRQRVNATPACDAFALYLAFHAGFRGDELFESPWMSILDLDPSMARDRALDAKRSGIIDLRIAGDVVSVDFSRIER